MKNNWSPWADPLGGEVIVRMRVQTHTVYKVNVVGRPGLEPVTLHTTQTRKPRSNRLSQQQARSLKRRFIKLLILNISMNLGAFFNTNLRRVLGKKRH